MLDDLGINCLKLKVKIVNFYMKANFKKHDLNLLLSVLKYTLKSYST